MNISPPPALLFSRVPVDPLRFFMRRLWDEGHDLESIAQHVQRCDHSRQDSRRAGTCNEFCAQSALVVPRAYGFSSTLLPVAWYDFKHRAQGSICRVLKTDPGIPAHSYGTHTPRPRSGLVLFVCLR